MKTCRRGGVGRCCQQALTDPRQTRLSVSSPRISTRTVRWDLAARDGGHVIVLQSYQRETTWLSSPHCSGPYPAEHDHLMRPPPSPCTRQVNTAVEPFLVVTQPRRAVCYRSSASLTPLFLHSLSISHHVPSRPRSQGCIHRQECRHGLSWACPLVHSRRQGSPCLCDRHRWRKLVGEGEWIS